jgi:hypothetical protein
VTLTAPEDGDSVSKKLEMKWKAEDDDKDTLLRKVYTSDDGGDSWKPLEEDLDEDEYEWDTEEMDDGRYMVKVVVSDELSNPGSPRFAEAIASPVIVDNTPPNVTEQKVGDVTEDNTVTISGLAVDDGGGIATIEYRIGDDGKYRGVASDDGLLDSRAERFSFTTNELDPGKREIQLRVGDAAENWFEDTVKVTVPDGKDEDDEKDEDEEGEEEEAEEEPEEEDDEKPAKGKKGKGKKAAAKAAKPDDEEK